MIEKEILGCILQDNSLINETVIRTTFFEKQEHQLLFQTMQKLAYENKAIDRVSLLAENYEYLSQFGTNFIAEIEASGKVENFTTYEKQLIEKYKKRQSKILVNNFLHQKTETSELIKQLQELDEIGLTEEQDTKQLLDDMYELPYKKMEDVGVKSGLTDLDAIIGGFQPANSYILGARPSMGKTATMLKFALEALKQDVVPVIFSLEMSKESLIRRLISTIGNINLFIANNPYNLVESKKQLWQKAINTLKKYDFEIFDEAGQTLETIRARTRQTIRKYNKDVIVLIDYLTLIKSTEKYQSEHLRIGDISKGLKELAKTYDCPVVTLAQLSRVVEQRQDKRPMLSDLRESGSIEEDADCVMFLYRDSYYNKESDDNLEINVAKHRNGPTGTATVYYNKSTGKMGDLNKF